MSFGLKYGSKLKIIHRLNIVQMKYQSTVSINQKDICIQFNLEANMIRNKEERKSGKDIVISSVSSLKS